MKTLKIGLSYIEWHYSLALADIVRNIKNLLWFIYHFFSIPLLARTFFAPWKRMDIDRARHEGVSDKFGRFVVNIMMRIVGMIMRCAVIIIGSVALLLTLWGGVLFFVVWIFLPFMVIVFFLKGVSLIF